MGYEVIAAALAGLVSSETSPCLTRGSHTAILIVYAASFIVAALAALTATLLMSHLLQRISPAATRRSISTNRTWFRIVVFICLAFLVGAGSVINRSFLPHKTHPASLLGNAAILLFTVFLGWCLLKPRIKRLLTLIAGAAALVALTLFLSLWMPSPRDATGPTPVDKLETLGYLNWHPTSGTRAGVTIIDQKKIQPGINIYCPQNLASAYLMDMNGRVLHEWSANFFGDDTWDQIELCTNGDLLGFVTDRLFFRLDWNSNVKWTAQICAHHDIAIAPNNDILVLAAVTELASFHGVPAPIYNNYIAVLSPDGEIKRRVSLYKVLKTEFGIGNAVHILGWVMRPANLKEMFRSQGRRGPSDLIHANTIEIIGRDVDEIFKKGRILTCSRSMNMIGVIDMETEKLVWSWGPGELEEPHDPTLLDNGNILLFDNGTRRRYSRVLELNPRTGRIEWSYGSDPESAFYTRRGGGNQRLPNGNTLITSTNRGRAFEVTPDGEVVWRFDNPELSPDGRERAGIYRMMRITDLDKYSHLRELEYDPR